jgi:hypothetical protein
MVPRPGGKVPIREGILKENLKPLSIKGFEHRLPDLPHGFPGEGGRDVPVEDEAEALPEP